MACVYWVVTGLLPRKIFETGLDIENMRLIPVNIGCGGLKTHKSPMSIELWRVYCRVVASVAGPTSKIPNVYAVCGAVAGPGGGTGTRERRSVKNEV
jgi:hypothetical protein